MQSLLMYTDLARYWRLLSPAEDYATDAAVLTGLIRSSTPEASTLLELGSGGGNTASHLREHFTVTLTDISPQMLDMSRELNPGSEHVLGDMRDLRLGRTFDAVLVHDAVDYMTRLDDLRRCVQTAAAHLVPGGTAVFLPDSTTEDYEPGTNHGGTDAPDGSGIRYLEWHHPVPEDSPGRSSTTYTYVLRTAAGEVTTLSETHTFGLFPRGEWLRLLDEAGLESAAVTVRWDTDGDDRLAFVGRRQPASRGPR